MNSVFPELCLCRHRPGVVIGSVASDAPCSAFQAALGTEEAVGCEMGSACPGTAAPSDPCQAWQRRTQTSSMCLKTQAPLCSLVEVSVFGGASGQEQCWELCWSLVRQGRAPQGVLARDTFTVPACSSPSVSLASRREMLVLRATPHTDVVPLPSVPVSSVVCSIWRCLSSFHNPQMPKVSHGRCPRDRGWEGTTCTTAQLQQGGEDARVPSDRCFGKQFHCWGLNRPSIICSTF